AVFEPAVDFSGYVLKESKKEVKSHFYVRGDFRRPGAEVTADVPRVVNVSQEKLTSSGRRTQFAKWLTRADHPLTGRVLVNRLWQQHFGRGLSETPSDFGLIGDDPTHKELLDWLATELVERGWSMKDLRRTIVTSATYRQASRPQSLEGDDVWR